MGSTAPAYKPAREEAELAAVFKSKRDAVHAALQNSIDTPTALKQLEQLIRATNTYMKEVGDLRRGSLLLSSIDRYFDRILGAFGVDRRGREGGAAASGAAGGTASALQVASALSTFRDGVRQTAIAGSKAGGADAEVARSMLRQCDEVRDEVLPKIGVLIEDRSSGVAQISLADPARLEAEAERRRAAAEQEKAEREKKAAERAAIAELERQRAEVPPLEMFTPQHDALFQRKETYGALDADGIPIEMQDGSPVSKSQRKKLVKLAAKQAKLHGAK